MAPKSVRTREEHREEEDVTAMDLQEEEEETRAMEFREEGGGPRFRLVDTGEVKQGQMSQGDEVEIEAENSEIRRWSCDHPDAASKKSSALAHVQTGEERDKNLRQSSEGATNTCSSSSPSSTSSVSLASAPSLNPSAGHGEGDRGTAAPLGDFSLRKRHRGVDVRPLVLRSGSNSTPPCLRSVCSLSLETPSVREGGTTKGEHGTEEKRSDHEENTPQTESSQGRSRAESTPDRTLDQERDATKETSSWSVGDGDPGVAKPEGTVVSEVSNEDAHEESETWKSTVRIVQRKKEECYCVTE